MVNTSHITGKCQARIRNTVGISNLGDVVLGIYSVEQRKHVPSRDAVINQNILVGNI